MPQVCRGTGMSHKCVVANAGPLAFMVGGVAKFTMEDADLFFKMLSPAPSTWSRL